MSGWNVALLLGVIYLLLVYGFLLIVVLPRARRRSAAFDAEHQRVREEIRRGGRRTSGNILP